MQQLQGQIQDNERKLVIQSGEVQWMNIAGFGYSLHEDRKNYCPEADHFCQCCLAFG